MVHLVHVSRREKVAGPADDPVELLAYLEAIVTIRTVAAVTAAA
jgi:hypothetical protein